MTLLRDGGGSRGQSHFYHEAFRPPCVRAERTARALTKVLAILPRGAVSARAAHAGAHFRRESRVAIRSRPESRQEKYWFRPGTLVTDQTGDMGYSPRASSVV